MTFDDGIVKVYIVKNTATSGNKPKYELVAKSQHYFGFETIGITRYRTALQTKSRIEELIHILEDRQIFAEDICILEDGLQYKCGQVQHTTEDGLRITKIELERLVEDYVISKDFQS